MGTALVDFSSLFHRMWHVNKDDAANKCASFLGTLSHDEVIICIDSPPYKRKEFCPSYKANRDVPDPELIGQLRAAIQKAADLGYTIASCEGWEADDVIATIYHEREIDAVYGTDKDLLQVCDLTDPFTKEIKTSESYIGVSRELVIDYLCMVGDSSDNVKGIDGIGPKKALDAITKFWSLKGMYDAVKDRPSTFSEKIATATMESLEWMDTTRQLITLRKDLNVKFEKKSPETVTEFSDDEPSKNQTVDHTPTHIQKATEPQYIVKTETVDYRHSLEPIGIQQAYRTAEGLFKSALYQQYKSPEQIMAVIMRGRTLGLDATTALDQMNVIQGRPTMSAQCMVAVVKSSPICEFLECIEALSDRATWETKRRGERKEHRRTFTREEADKAGFTTAKEYDKVAKRYTGRIITKDNWEKQPHVMLQWRAAAALIRQVYPDLILGIYTTEEME